MMADLGSTSKGFSDLYLADGAVIKFGDDQDVTLTHNADVGLTLNTKLTVTGQTELNDAIALNTNSITQTGTNPLLRIKDSNAPKATAGVELRFQDNGDNNAGVLVWVEVKLFFITMSQVRVASFSIVEGTRSSHADSFYIDMTKNAAASTVVNAQTNIAFSNSTITGGGSSFSSVSAEVIEVSGAGQAQTIKNLELYQKRQMFLQFVLQMVVH